MYKRLTHANIILFCSNHFNAINIECMLMMKTLNKRITQMKNQTFGFGASQLVAHYSYKVFYYYPNTVNWKRFANIISAKVLNYVVFCLRTQLRLKLRKRGSGTSIRLSIRKRNNKKHDENKKEKIEGLYFILRLFMADIRILATCKRHRFRSYDVLV